MKLLLEQWREFVKQEVEEFLPHGEVRAVKKIGSSTLSPEEQAEQDLEKYGYVRDEGERDFDIEVQIAGVSNEDVEEWAFSEEAEELESSYNYDVQLRIVENWRGYLAEISMEDLKAFGEKFKNSDNVEKLAARLAELGWDANAIKHHKEEEPPYAEIRHIILNLDKYEAPKSAEMISSDEMVVDDESMREREQRYQDYKSGKIDRYFRDSDYDPDKTDFSKVPPVTLVQQPNGSLEVADGMHRVFLAKKTNAELPAWVIRLK